MNIYLKLPDIDFEICPHDLSRNSHSIDPKVNHSGSNLVKVLK